VAVWAARTDGSTHQNQSTLAPPALCGQTTGNSEDNGQRRRTLAMATTSSRFRLTESE
jgi:hypothetical protein